MSRAPFTSRLYLFGLIPIGPIMASHHIDKSAVRPWLRPFVVWRRFP